MQLRVRAIERIVTSACIVALVAPHAAWAQPTPTTPQIEQKRSEASVAEDQLDELQAQLEMRAEEYAAVTDELQATRQDITDTRARLEAADLELAKANALLEDRAAGIYRTGSPGILEVLLDTASFTDFLTRMDWLQRVGRSDAKLVSSVKSARAEVVINKQSLERREAEQIILRDRARIAERDVQAALKNQSDYVQGLNAEVASLVAQERQRQEALALERARLAEQAARLAAAKANIANRPVTDPGQLGPGRPEVLVHALQFVGKVEYVWGGSTPAGFDCSGLTKWCYAQIGITIPRTSRFQFRVGSHIGADRIDLLLPGDLVFFGYDGDPNRVHHVGIYAGNGDYVHAPATGERVTVSSLIDRIAAKGDYVGASRF
ncbi:MAG: C40 family peptidase [Coriobacteriia bacterium]